MPGWLRQGIQSSDPRPSETACGSAFSGTLAGDPMGPPFGRIARGDAPNPGIARPVVPAHCITTMAPGQLEVIRTSRRQPKKGKGPVPETDKGGAQMPFPRQSAPGARIVWVLPPQQSSAAPRTPRPPRFGKPQRSVHRCMRAQVCPGSSYAATSRGWTLSGWQGPAPHLSPRTTHPGQRTRCSHSHPRRARAYEP